MTTKQLKDLLTDMADEVQPTRVHERAVAQSKRIGRRNAILASITALLLTGSGLFGFSVLAHGMGNDGEHQVADGELPTSDVNKLSGTYYQVMDPDSGPESVVSWQPGGDEVAEPLTAIDTEDQYYNTGNVSPNGEYFSYMTSPSNDGGDPEVTDRIFVASFADTASGEVAQYSAAEDLCAEPVWAPDSKRIFVDRGSAGDGDRTGFVDVETSEFTSFPVENPCDAQVATNADGEDLVFSTEASGDSVEVYATNSSGERTATGAAKVMMESGRYITELVAVSPDGRFLCVSTESEPGSYTEDMSAGRYGYCDAIIDTGAKEEIEVFDNNGVLPTGSPSVFAIPGRLLLEGDDGKGNGIHLLYDYDGKLIDEATSPMGEESLPSAFVPD